MGFVHLHTHTAFSLLDGAGSIKKIVERARELNMSALSITDHGVMYGVIDFYKECKKNGIKPIIGCEVYTAARTRFLKEHDKDSESGHLILLAENMCGYKNLLKIVSRSFTEGYYYKPRVDFELLSEYSEGIIALSACLAGDIPRAILANDYVEAKKLTEKYISIFGRDNFFIEIQNHGIEEQIKVFPQLCSIAEEYGLGLVATNDVHYVNKEDAESQDVLMCIQTAKTVDEEDRMKFSTDEFYLKSEEEMETQFSQYKDSLLNTALIADRCNVEFDFNSIHLPEYKMEDGKDAFLFLEEKCYAGLKDRYNEDAVKHEERLKFELDTIKKMNYVDYFLIVWDFIKYAKDRGIAVGPGRGSAAGSLVSYCLHITDVDPIKYGLIFERFLNPERISMPDIDIDFCIDRRGEVIDYVTNKYGFSRVSQIITFGTMAARAVIRDVGRALNIPYNKVDIIAKMVPFELHITIEKALKISSELRELYESDESVKKLIDTAKILEGLPRHASTHAAGVVISKDELSDYVPIQMMGDTVVTQFPMNTLEELGLLKMDFLGLRNLTIIQKTIREVERRTGEVIDFDKIPLSDAGVYEMISEGDTDGVFQLESNGMKQVLKELKPERFEDIIAVISLYRPGPMEQIPRYIFNKNSASEIKYKHKLLEPILNVTYGCMVYQEQVMKIFRELAGYSMGRADLVRRAMSKKKLDVMEKEREHFIHGLEDGENSVEGAVKRGVSADIADKIYDEMIDFANYAFNKSHAAAYAVVSYRTAYLKKYYSVYYMSELLNSIFSHTDSVVKYISTCKEMGIRVLAPDINESMDNFSANGKVIRFGLAAIKNMGKSPSDSIVNERERNGKFTSFYDFCERLSESDVNKRAINGLIKAGAFDSLNPNRAYLMTYYERIIDDILDKKRNNISGQISFMDSDEKDENNRDNMEELPFVKPYDAKTTLTLEKEAIGLYMSGHPLDDYDRIIKHRTSHTISQIVSSVSEDIDTENNMMNNDNVSDGEKVIIFGMVMSVKIKTTRSGSQMAFCNVEDKTGSVEVIMFANMLDEYKKYLNDDKPLLISGRVSLREDEEAKIVCERIVPITSESNEKVYIKFENKEDEKKERVFETLKKHNGDTPVYIYYEEEKSTSLCPKSMWVNICQEFLHDIHLIMEKNCVKIIEH